jgi:hypothetical protein
MGEIPVEGPTTTTGLQVVETLHAYGAFGLQPSAVVEPVYLTVSSSDPAPYGAEVGRCQTQTCEDGEVPEILQPNVDYNAYEGWYFLRTTAGCYDVTGNIRDEVMEWVSGVFCGVIPECAANQPVTGDPILALQGISAHPDASYIMKFNGPNAERGYLENYGSLGYCATPCYDTNTYSNGDWNPEGYDGTTAIVEVEAGVEYDVGSSGGQFVMYATQSQYTTLTEHALNAGDEAA